MLFLRRNETCLIRLTDLGIAVGTTDGSRSVTHPVLGRGAARFVNTNVVTTS